MIGSHELSEDLAVFDPFHFLISDQKIVDSSTQTCWLKLFSASYVNIPPSVSTGVWVQSSVDISKTHIQKLS